MPYLQLDTSASFNRDDKARFAAALADCYAKTMAMDHRRISVAIRELGEDGLWRLIDGVPCSAHVLMCDIRRGRDASRRQVLAEAMLAVCERTLGLARQRVNIEFTQHSADEMYHPALGGFSPEWSPTEEGSQG